MKPEMSQDRFYPLLIQFVKELLCENDLHQMITLALDWAVEAIGAQKGSIILYDRSGKKLLLVARNLNKENIDRDSCLNWKIIEQVKSSTLTKSNPDISNSDIAHQPQSGDSLIICIPLVNKRMLGVFYLDLQNGMHLKPTSIKLLKEFTELIACAIAREVEQMDWQNPDCMAEEELRDWFDFHCIIGHHPKLIDALRLVAQVADTPATVLIQGETGTGKELIAQALHDNSSRRNKPFVPINCAALSESLLESELFGHVRGAFTGAVRTKKGWFESANGGTLFLDEVNDMPIALQIRLLRILQTKKYTRVGSTEFRDCDVRVVAATNQDLKKLVANGQFREEVFYRLNTINLYLPPLRERKSDILVLANHFLQLYGTEQKKKDLRLSKKAESLLIAYDFYGNIRELENLIHHAVILTHERVIQPCHFQDNLHSKQIVLDLESNQKSIQDVRRMTVEKVEREHIIENLQTSHGNIRQAARLMGIHVTNLHIKLKKYGIQASLFKNHQA